MRERNESDQEIEKILVSDKLLIGLTAPREELNRRIDERVEARVEQGIVKEIQLLLDQGYTWDLPALSALGYNIWEEYFTRKSQLTENEQKKLIKEIIHLWSLKEQQYAKRQITWFKKEPGIHWFDITQPEWQTIALTLIKKWKANKQTAA